MRMTEKWHQWADLNLQYELESMSSSIWTIELDCCNEVSLAVAELDCGMDYNTDGGDICGIGTMSFELVTKTNDGFTGCNWEGCNDTPVDDFLDRWGYGKSNSSKMTCLDNIYTLLLVISKHIYPLYLEA